MFHGPSYLLYSETALLGSRLRGDIIVHFIASNKWPYVGGPQETPIELMSFIFILASFVFSLTTDDLSESAF